MEARQSTAEDVAVPNIHGFSIKEVLHRSERTLIVRAVRERDGRAVVLKSGGSRADDSRERALVREFEFGKGLASPKIPEYLELSRRDGRLLLVEQDGGMPSLASGIPEKGFEPERFFALAIEIAAALGDLHRAGVVHRDVHPANIIADPSRGKVMLIDLGLAGAAGGEVLDFVAPTQLRGSVAYISPEQTGRINRPVDARSDLYSLGITLFQMLTGRLPFVADSPAEAIYCHLAKQPPSLRTVKSQAPPGLALCIDKLLRKSPDERYQTTTGLLADLERLQRAYADTGSSPADFRPGENDLPAVIEIGSGLYGRTAEVTQLHELLTKSRLQSQSAIVHGPAGIGKTALVQELYQPLTKEQGFFLSGKFEKLGRGLAFTVLAEALTHFVEQCLARDVETVEATRQALSAALGDFGQVIVDVAPAFARLIGEQPRLATVSPVETEDRRNRMFASLFLALGTLGQPITLFIDDLQWADAGSLALLEVILRANPPRLFLILSYRDDELAAAPPARAFVERLTEAAMPLRKIGLAPLGDEAVDEWIGTLLPQEPELAAALAELVRAKTGNNPFQVQAFLHTLREQGLLYRDERGHATADLEAIAPIPGDEDMAAHLIRRLEGLDDDAGELLCHLAVLGRRFSLATVDLLLQQTYADYASTLERLAAGCFVSRAGDEVFFSHDKVQEAARRLLPDEQARRLHLRVGTALKATLTEGGQDGERLGDYLHHLNAAKALITHPAERLALSKLNTRMGKRLKANAAFVDAGKAFAEAEELLSPRPFEDDYDHAVELLSEHGEVLLLTSRPKEGEQRLAAVIRHARSPIDLAGAYVKQISYHGAHNDVPKAMEFFGQALSSLNVRLPRRQPKLAILAELAKVSWLLRRTQPQDVPYLPVNENPLSRAQMHVLEAALVAAYIGYPDFFPLIVLRMVGLSVSEGNCDVSTFAWITYGIILSGLGASRQGGAYGRAALELMEKLGAKRFEAKTFFLYAVMIHHWTKPATESIGYLETAVESGIASGDYEFASMAASCVMQVAFYAGRSIDELLLRYPKQHQVLAALNKKAMIFSARFWNQMLLTLSAPGGDGVTIKGELSDEDEHIARLVQGRELSSLSASYLTRMQLAYLAGDMARAAAQGQLALEHAAAMTGMFFIPPLHFFMALTCIALHRGSDGSSAWLNKAAKHHRKLKRWGADSPTNYLHKAQLVEAELLAAKDKPFEAMGLYEQAIENASKNGNSLDLGIACECAGRHMQRHGLGTAARAYLRRSMSVFHSWGARNKSTRLARELDIPIEDTAPAAASVSTASTSYGSGLAERLDLEALAETIGVVTTEVELQPLLARLLEGLLFRSCATRAVYVLVQGERLVKLAELDAEGPVRHHDPQSHTSEPTDLPLRLFGELLDGSAEVVRTNLSEPGTPLRSILILPLRRKDQIAGFVYLENSLTPDAFQDSEVRFLSLLAGQAAIGIQNALTFERLQQQHDFSNNLIRSNPSLICGIDEGGKTTFANPAVEGVTGYSRDELVGSSWWELLCPGEQYKQVDRLFAALDQGEVTDHEMVLSVKNGARRTILYNWLPQRDAGGKLVQVLGFGSDITERKQAEEDLRRLRNYLANIIDSMPSALIGVDTEGKVTQWNSEAAKVTGIVPQEADGQPLQMVFPRLAGDMERVREAMRTREVQAAHRQPRKANGETRYEDLTVYPLTANGIEGAVIRLDDVTERVRIEEMMVQSEKMLSVGGLAAGMAHEINNPLGGMIQTASVMSARMTDPDLPANIKAAEQAGITMEALSSYMQARKIPDMIERIRTSGLRAAKIVRNMLSFAQKANDTWSSYNLADLLDRCVDLACADYDLRKKHDFRQIEIVREYEEDLPRVLCDASKIQQVLLNILRNGAEAMQGGKDQAQPKPADRPRFFLRVAHEREAGMVCVEIEDNGPGMPEEVRRRVFEPFFTTKPTDQGTGLGLSVSYFIITENHDGVLSVESELGRGTKFVVRLAADGS